MSRAQKTEQLQIRVSPAQKAAIQRAAVRAGLDVSAYMLARVSEHPAQQFAALVARVGQGEPRFALAELNHLLTTLTAAEVLEAVAGGVPRSLAAFPANYVAAMVELACAQRELPLPAWTREIAPLTEPVFASNLRSLRLHLLTHSPAPFRRRNLYIDSSLHSQI